MLFSNEIYVKIFCNYKNFLVACWKCLLWQKHRQKEKGSKQWPEDECKKYWMTWTTFQNVQIKVPMNTLMKK